MREKIHLRVYPWYAYRVVKDAPDKEEVEVEIYWDLGYARGLQGSAKHE